MGTENRSVRGLRVNFFQLFLEFFSAQVRSHDFTVRTEKYGGRDAPYTVNGTGFAVPGFQI